MKVLLIAAAIAVCLMTFAPATEAANYIDRHYSTRPVSILQGLPKLVFPS